MTSLSLRAVPIVSGASLLVLCATAPASAQSHPFPTSGNYAHGFIPAMATAAAVQSSYANWKNKYLLSDCGNGYYRVDNSNGDHSTFSEGQGYGMVLTAYFGDRTQFDGLWAFAQKYFNKAGTMGWHVTCAGPTSTDGGGNSATDGDTDIGFGLLVAAAQWGGTYEQTAKTYLAAMKASDFTTCSPTGRNVPNAGNWDSGNGGGGCKASNTSYWMPAYYRVFQQVTGDSYWGKAADDIVDLYSLAADPTTGIIVNEVDQNGKPVAGQTYDYNSCRIPWRAALDYLWYGTPAVATQFTKLSAWASSIGISHVVDGYAGNGTATGKYTGLNAFVGGFTAGAMVDSASMVDTFAAYFLTISDDNGSYYGSSLRTLYLLTLSGNEWNPLTVGDAGAGPIATSGSPAPGMSGAVGSGAVSGESSGSPSSTSGSPAASGAPGTSGNVSTGGLPNSSGSASMSGSVSMSGSSSTGATTNESAPTSRSSGGCALAPGQFFGGRGLFALCSLLFVALRRRARKTQNS
jgi:endo-1,4-beta-D-glucanase Y